MKLGKGILGRRHVHPFVAGTLKQMQVEGTFKTGTHLITIHNPISTDEGDLKMALYGSFLPIPTSDLFPTVNEADFHPLAMPGAIRAADTGDIVLNASRNRVRLTVTNQGTRAVHVGHYTPRYVFVVLTWVIRSALTFTSWKQTPISTSTAERPTAITSIFRLESFCALSRMNR